MFLLPLSPHARPPGRPPCNQVGPFLYYRSSLSGTAKRGPDGGGGGEDDWQSPCCLGPPVLLQSDECVEAEPGNLGREGREHDKIKHKHFERRGGIMSP
jgi:hypothetical protein